MPMSSTWTSCEYAVTPSRRNRSIGSIVWPTGLAGLRRSVTMIGRPPAQFSGGCFCLFVAAGPPVHSHRQWLMHVVVCPVGSCSKAISFRSAGFLASTT